MINLKKKAWFEGLTDENVLAVVSKHAHESVACYIQDEMAESEWHYDHVRILIDEIIPYLVDEKTWYYMGNQEQYKRFDKLHMDLLVIKRGMQDGIYNAYKNKEMTIEEFERITSLGRLPL